jgi:hypothetical protein
VSILDLSKNTDARLEEVRKLLAHIKRLEASAVTERDVVSGETAAILRGVFFVHLYGVLEYAVSQSVQVLLQEITKMGVPYSHFDHLFFVVALDSDFRSLVDAGWSSRFPRRRELLKKQVSTDSCDINDTLFHDQLQNIWFETLSIVFEYLCIPASPVPETRMRGYVDEIVNHRNEIAHGRSSASFVGRLKSSSELDERLRAVSQIIDHIIINFDNYFAERTFVAAAHRASYQNQAPPIPPAVQNPQP